MAIIGYNPAPGQQQREKYPRTGPNYLMYGEQPGWIYDYSTDRYRRDPKVDEELGLREPTRKDPSAASTIGTIAAASAASAAALEGGKAIGSGLLSLGSSAAPAVAATPAAGAAGTVAGTTAATTGAAEAGTAAAGGSGALAGVAVPAAVALAAVLAGKSAYGMATGTGKNFKNSSIADKIGRGILAGATGGLSEVYNKVFGGQKSTKQRVENRTQGLLGMSDDAGWQSGVSALRASAHPEGDTGENFNEEAAKAKGLTPEDMWGSYGVLNTFGPDWLGKYGEANRRKITQGLIDANLFDSKKGDWMITDEDKAREIANGILSGGPQSVSPQTAQGLLGVGVDAGTAKRWRENKARAKR